jgi:hypothetical protein
MQETRKKRGLVHAAIITGLLVVFFLAFTVNRGPLTNGFAPYEPKARIKTIAFGVTRRTL